jgi:hypothetical protein
MMAPLASLPTSSFSSKASTSKRSKNILGILRGNDVHSNAHYGNKNNDDDDIDDYDDALTGPSHDERTSSKYPDLRKIFAESATKNKINSSKSSSYSYVGGNSSTRSLSSYTTQWSTITTPISNTTQQRESNKKRKRRFLQFTKILMNLLKRVDPARYGTARAMIQDCEERKKRGDVQSMTDSLKRPLKEAVGPKYWKLAREREREMTIQHLFHLDDEPLDVTAVDESPPLGEHELSILLDTLRDDSVDVPPPPPTTRRTVPTVRYSSTTTTNPTSFHVVDDLKTRKKRLWMIICILMKYLERTNKDLYSIGKMIVSDCVRRHRLKEEGYLSLSGSIQSSLKREIGPEYWRRAERYVARTLLNHLENSTSSPTLTTTRYGATQLQSIVSSSSSLSSTIANNSSIVKKRFMNGARVHFEGKRPRQAYEI